MAKLMKKHSNETGINNFREDSLTMVTRKLMTMKKAISGLFILFSLLFNSILKYTIKEYNQMA